MSLPNVQIITPPVTKKTPTICESGKLIKMTDKIYVFLKKIAENSIDTHKLELLKMMWRGIELELLKGDFGDYFGRNFSFKKV